MSSVPETHDIEYILEEVVTLPSLPNTVANITKLVNDPDCPLSKIAKAISGDPSIALKSLRLVNSAYYGLREKVNSVDHAVVLLGMKVIKNLVFTATVFDTLHSDEEALMRHSICCGVVMKILVESGALKECPIEDPDEAFVFGLLHDVGKIIIGQFMSKESALVAEASNGREIPWCAAEREILGFDHAEMGAELALKWKLTDVLVGAIAGHHDVNQCTDPAYRGAAALLSIANYISYAAGFPAKNSVPPKLDPEVWKITGLTTKDIQPILDQFFDSTDDIEELLQLAA